MNRIIYDKLEPKTAKIKLLADINCPLCKIARKRLEYLENNYFPHLFIDYQLTGTISSPIQEGTIFSYGHIGRKVDSTNYTKMFSDGAVPVTLCSNGMKIVGIDKFMSKLEKLLDLKSLREVMSGKVTRLDMQRIDSGYYDAIDYIHMIHDKFIYPETGISIDHVLKYLQQLDQERNDLYAKFI